jgi:hypothetical protein
LREASFNSEKIVSGPRISVRSLYKKITVACLTDKGDPSRLTIVANKCSIVRNAPCRMNMHPPRRLDSCPLLLPRSELHRRCPPVLPHRRTHVALRLFVWRCTCEDQGPRLSEQHNYSIGLDLFGELSSFPLVPCPDCGMSRVVEGRTQKEGGNHSRLYFKCARNSVSSLLCLPNLS